MLFRAAGPGAEVMLWRASRQGMGPITSIDIVPKFATESPVVHLQIDHARTRVVLLPLPIAKKGQDVQKIIILDGFKGLELQRIEVEEEVSGVAAARGAFWRSLWAQSSGSLPQSRDVQGFWETAQYLLGSASRKGKVATGLWGPRVFSDNPGWQGAPPIGLTTSAQIPFR